MAVARATFSYVGNLVMIYWHPFPQARALMCAGAGHSPSLASDWPIRAVIFISMINATDGQRHARPRERGVTRADNDSGAIERLADWSPRS